MNKNWGTPEKAAEIWRFRNKHNNENQPRNENK